jgi:AcrR family transcriptional regulator
MDQTTTFLTRTTSEGRLLRAAVDVIASEGIDGMSVGKVSAAAELTRPTFYAYFESMSGLLATMWMELGPAWLETVPDLSSTPEQMDPARQRMHRAMLEVLATAHRNPEVLEVVQPTVAQWWESVVSQGQFHAEKVAWLVSQRIGADITAPIDPDATSSGVLGLVLAALPQAPSLPDGRDVSFDVPSLNTFDPVGTDDDDERLVLAAINVIARSGVRGASMARIARRAQVSTGAIYPRFPSIDDVIERSFDYAVRAIVADNFDRVQEAGSPHDYGMVILAGLSPSRRTWRDYRIEIHLEARHHPSLATRLAGSIREANEILVNSSEFLSRLPKQIVSPLPYLIHCLGIGLSVLQNAGVPVGGLDHPRISVEVGQFLRTMSH